MPEMHTYNPIIHQTKKQCPIVLCHSLSTLNSNQPLFRLTINNKSNYNSKVLNPQPYQAKDTIKQYPVIPEHNHGRYKLHWNHNVTDHRPSTYCILWCFLLFCFFKPRALMVRRLSKYKTVICGLRRYISTTTEITLHYILTTLLTTNLYGCLTIYHISKQFSSPIHNLKDTHFKTTVTKVKILYTYWVTQTMKMRWGELVLEKKHLLTMKL